MKNIKTLLLLLLLLLTIFIVSCKKEETITLTIHYNDDVINKEVNKGSIVDIENMDDDYVLIGWFNEDYTINYTNQEINTDLEIYSKTFPVGTQFTISYKMNDSMFLGSIVSKYKVGQTTKLPTPTKEPYYKFKGYMCNNELITEISNTMYGNLELECIFEDTANYYNITYNLGNGTTNDEFTTILRQGETSSLPVCTPNNKDEIFYGWYTDNNELVEKLDTKNMTSDLNLTAKYGTRDASHTYISFLGDSITTFQGYIPQDMWVYYPRGDVQTVEDTWWHKLTTRLGYKLLMNNAHSGSKVLGGNLPANTEERIKYLVRDGITPDIVVIYMGTNDWAAGTTKEQFKEAFKTTIDLTYKYCGDDTKIYVCLLPTNTYSSGYQVLRENINKALIEVINERDLYTIDFRLGITEENVASCTYAEVHPNALGMTKLADVAYQVIYDTDLKFLNK